MPDRRETYKGKPYYTYRLAVMSTLTVIHVYRCVYSIVSLGIIHKTVTWRPDHAAKYAGIAGNVVTARSVVGNTCLLVHVLLLTKEHQSAV